MKPGFVIIAILGLANLALADDGYIEFGGNPKLMSSHRSIELAWENVSVHAYDRRVYVTADFVFKNHGSATKVRMGFPDQGSHDDQGEDELIRPKSKLPEKDARLHSFKSWVNGKQMTTALVGSGDSGKRWHTKTVSFGRKATVRIRNTYWTYVGGGFIGALPNGNDRISSDVLYIMHTGASWRGKIGYAKVTVQIHDSALLLPFQIAKGENWSDTMLRKPQQVAVAWGFCRPVVRGRIFIFERKNFEPDEVDDVAVRWMSRYKSPPNK